MLQAVCKQADKMNQMQVNAILQEKEEWLHGQSRGEQWAKGVEGRATGSEASASSRWEHPQA
jgi:hypothetical protein